MIRADLVFFLCPSFEFCGQLGRGKDFFSDTQFTKAGGVCKSAPERAVGVFVQVSIQSFQFLFDVIKASLSKAFFGQYFGEMPVLAAKVCFGAAGPGGIVSDVPFVVGSAFGLVFGKSQCAGRRFHEEAFELGFFAEKA